MFQARLVVKEIATLFIMKYLNCEPGSQIYQ